MNGFLSCMQLKVGNLSVNYLAIIYIVEMKMHYACSYYTVHVHGFFFLLLVMLA